jgi:hypothetical protein
VLLHYPSPAELANKDELLSTNQELKRLVDGAPVTILTHSVSRDAHWMTLAALPGLYNLYPNRMSIVRAVCLSLSCRAACAVPPAWHGDGAGQRVAWAHLPSRLGDDRRGQIRVLGLPPSPTTTGMAKISFHVCMGVFTLCVCSGGEKEYPMCAVEPPHFTTPYSVDRHVDTYSGP